MIGQPHRSMLSPKGEDGYAMVVTIAVITILTLLLVVVLAVLPGRPLGEVRQRREHRRDPLPVHALLVRGGQELPVLREDAAGLDLPRERPQVRQHAIQVPRRLAPFRHTPPFPDMPAALYPMGFRAVLNRNTRGWYIHGPTGD